MRSVLLLSTLVIAAPVTAAGGMWLPSQAAQLAPKLAAAGLEVPAAAIGDMAAAPMNAIVSLGGCSASFVSPQGLVATNHHCITSSLQVNSTPERNILRDAFVARTRAEELPAAPGTRILATEELRDVTADVLAGTQRLRGKPRVDRIDAARKRLIAECEDPAKNGPGRRCDVRAYFGGAQYFLQRQLEIRDVRLVYAPAASVGNFGGEIDNWQWPRHTGDFSFYRAYVGPDGNPAARADANVPYRPRGHLKLATGDLKEGDFVMIAGFPGVTERFRTLAETQAYFSDIYPLQQRLLTEYSDLIQRETKTEAERIAYASALRGADNIKKKIEGQLAAARTQDLEGRKRAAETALGEWVAQPANRRTHALAIANYDGLIPEVIAADRARLVANLLNRAQLLRTARDLYRWANERQKPDVQREIGFQDRDRQALVDRLNLVARTYVPRIDRAVFEQALAENRKLPPASRNAGLDAALAATSMDALYAGTKLADNAERLAWLDRAPADFQTSDDPFIRLAVASYADDIAGEARRKDREGRVHAARVAWQAAVAAHAQSRGELLYPDANGTLRFTYGRVGGGPVRDGLTWTSFTTPAGILAKDTGAEPFNSPPALLAAIRAGDFGASRSASLGTMPVNFLSDTDITNGNSGSAVLNGRGELVGLAFDGTMEGMLSDWQFDPATTRTISVDARYMRFVMDRIDGGAHLLREMEGR